MGGFYFVTPETVRCLVARAGLRVVRDLGEPDASNTYYNRDYLALLAPVVDAAAIAPVVAASPTLNTASSPVSQDAAAVAAMDEDEIVDAVEAAEASGDCAAVVRLLGSALALDEPETAVEAVADALLRLGTAHAAALGEAGACERVAAALALPCCGDEPSLAEVLLGAAACSAPRRANAAKLLLNDGAARLVSAMEAHVASGEPTLQEQAASRSRRSPRPEAAAGAPRRGRGGRDRGRARRHRQRAEQERPDRALAALGPPVLGRRPPVIL